MSNHVVEPQSKPGVNRWKAIVFGILTNRNQVEDAAGGSVRKAYNEKTLKPHLTD
jgi:hypothetical protein